MQNKHLPSIKRNKWYLEKIQRHFSGHLKLAKVCDSEQANKWIAKKSNNFLTNILEQKYFNADYSMLLVNFVDFECKWLDTMPNPEVIKLDAFGSYFTH